MKSKHEGSNQRSPKEDGLLKVRLQNEPERAQMRRVVSLPMEEIASLEEYSSAEEEVGSDEEENGNVKIGEKICQSEEVWESSSPAPPSSLSILHGDEVDLSPRSISLLEAGESAGKHGIEKLLLERLLARKELRLVAMQEKVELQNKRLREMEARLAWLEAIPGLSLLERLGSYLLKFQFGQRTWAKKAEEGAEG